MEAQDTVRKIPIVEEETKAESDEVAGDEERADVSSPQAKEEKEKMPEAVDETSVIDLDADAKKEE